MNSIWILSALLVIPAMLRLRAVVGEPDLRNLSTGIMLVSIGGALHQIWWMLGLYLSGPLQQYADWTTDYVAVIKLLVIVFIFVGYSFHMKTALKPLSDHRWYFYPIGIGTSSFFLALSLIYSSPYSYWVSSIVDCVWTFMGLAVIPMTILLFKNHEEIFMKQIAIGIALVAFGASLHQGYWWLSVVTAKAGDVLMATWAIDNRTILKTIAAIFIFTGYLLHVHSYLVYKLKHHWWVPIPIIMILSQSLVTYLYN